jgi:succinyl-diaminopimelate desuccinylase
MRDWLTSHGVPSRALTAKDTGDPVGLVCDVPGARPGPRYVLDACIDTAPFGDPTVWRHPPTSGVIENGRLYGRGSADSKAAAAIFAHIAVRLWRQRQDLRGTLTVLLDADEHTGRFGGAKAYFADEGPDVAGVMIGYPGHDELVIGGRGFLRARIVVVGHAAHTGSARSSGYANAVERSATLVESLAQQQVPGPVDPVIGLPPKLTVTAIHGGDGYSVVPDRCVVNVDMRLTSTFDAAAARRLLEDTIMGLRIQHTIEYEETWPAYRLPDTAPIRAALLDAARRHLRREPDVRVAGPSNIGNFLAGLGIHATAGFGVGYEALHGTDERIDIATIPMVQATYHDAVLSLLAG